MSNKVILGSMAMDLKRVAIGYYKGSFKTVDLFLKEALKRKRKVAIKSVKPYIQKILDKIEGLKFEEKQKAAEDALMYSTIIQNAALHIS